MLTWFQYFSDHFYKSYIAHNFIILWLYFFRLYQNYDTFQAFTNKGFSFFGAFKKCLVFGSGSSPIASHFGPAITEKLGENKENNFFTNLS